MHLHPHVHACTRTCTHAYTNAHTRTHAYACTDAGRMTLTEFDASHFDSDYSSTASDTCLCRGLIVSELVRAGAVVLVCAGAGRVWVRVRVRVRRCVCGCVHVC